MWNEPRSSPTFAEVLTVRLNRRRFLQAGVAAAGAAALAPVLGASVAPPSEADGAAPRPWSGARPLGFSAIRPSTDDEFKVPAGYSAACLVGWGDPLRPGLPPFDPDTMTAAEQEQRFGYNCDFVAFLPLPGEPLRPDRGLLWVNHESTDEGLMYRSRSDKQQQVDVALAAHGGSLLEVRRRGGGWIYEPDSPFNRRITGTTLMYLTGPAAGHEWLRTRDDRSGRSVLGMLSNCSGGVTPWGTILTAEENFDHYFAGKEDFHGDAKVQKAHEAYLTNFKKKGWEEWHPRFNVACEPHEPFRFGWIVEINPYDPHDVPKKRTALGRFKHEAAVTVLSADGRPVVYSGDDEAGQYVYKFVASTSMYHRPSRAHGALLDHGTLYAARFEADGTGTWLPLTYGTEPLDRNEFTSQADVLIRARRAATTLEATRMDRPEDIEVSPRSGRVYLSMTKNDKRESKDADAANPRVANRLGHVIELTEDGDDPAATRFRWEIFLLCGHPDHLVTDPPGPPVDFKTSYFAGYGKSESDCGRSDCLSPIATPDNLVFDDAGHLWIATDGQKDAIEANDALHAVPTDGRERGRVQQFLSAPCGAEVTGPCFSPDYRALFVSIQHPGRGKDEKEVNSLWPDGHFPPRPGVVVVTKDDGGIIGT